MGDKVVTLCGWCLRLFERQDGQGLVEYMLILFLVSIVAITALTGLGETIVTKLYGLASSL